MSAERNETLVYLDKALAELTKAHDASPDTNVCGDINDIKVTISDLVKSIEESMKGDAPDENESLRSWLQSAQMKGGRL